MPLCRLSEQSIHTLKKAQEIKACELELICCIQKHRQEVADIMARFFPEKPKAKGSKKSKEAPGLTK